MCKRLIGGVVQSRREGPFQGRAGWLHSVLKPPVPYDNRIGVLISCLVGAFSVIVKTDCKIDGALHSTTHQPATTRIQLPKFINLSTLPAIMKTGAGKGNIVPAPVLLCTVTASCQQAGKSLCANDNKLPKEDRT